MTRPTPSPAQCLHERTYYDDKGERCHTCGEYVARIVRREPKRKEPQ